MSPRAPAAACLALCAALLCAGRLRVPFGDDLFFTRESASLPPARDCERCHQEVYREWEASLHARAWRSEAFELASAGRRAEECLGCHAPGPLAADRPPALRDPHREEGVTCVSCHLDPGSAGARLTMRGPVSRSSPVEVHPVIEGDARYRSSELCGSCHRATLAEWQRAPAAPDGRETETCQGCHMPAVRRKLESVHDEHAYSRVLVALEREEDLRRHAFAVPDDTGEWIGLEASLAPGAVLDASLANRLPHALPTGQFGRRQLALEVRWAGGTRRAEVVPSKALAIAAGETRHVRVELPASALASALHVSLLRFDHALGDWSEIAALDVPAPR
jgi:hypothetical protein